MTQTRWQKHGITPAEFERMRDEQQGLCYLCRDPLPDDPHFLAIDHDHRCCPAKKSCAYCRRGLTCHSCNLVIGHVRDNPERLRRIAGNLEVALTAAAQRIASKPSQASLFEAPERARTAAKRPRAIRQQPRGALVDVLKVFTDTNALHWPVIVERLAAQFPDRWAEATPRVISAQCRALGVPSVTVSVGGCNGRGCRKVDLMTALTRKTPLVA